MKKYTFGSSVTDPEPSGAFRRVLDRASEPDHVRNAARVWRFSGAHADDCDVHDLFETWHLDLYI